MPVTTKKTVLSWSSGKDSSWALHTLRKRPEFELVGLLTTINSASNRVAMHAVRDALLEKQAQAVGLPLFRIPIPSPCSNEEYESAMERAVHDLVERGVEVMAFGDLFLEDVRKYREDALAATELEPVFPIWGSDTKELAAQMVAAGVRAHITCVDPKQLDRSFCGRTYDEAFLAELPAGIDPCGEKGEFHTFVYAGPMFSHEIPVVPGPVIERDGFVFADLSHG